MTRTASVKGGATPASAPTNRCLVVSAFITVLLLSLCAAVFAVVRHTSESATSASSSSVAFSTNSNLATIVAKSSLRSNDVALSTVDTPAFSTRSLEQSSAPVDVKSCRNVELEVSSTSGVGKVLLKVHHDWAPLGAARFCELVDAKYYDEVKFFRVIKVCNCIVCDTAVVALPSTVC
jgi:hypothetical protein